MPGNNNIVLCWLCVCVFLGVLLLVLFICCCCCCCGLLARWWFFFVFCFLIFSFFVCFVSVPIHGFINNLAICDKFEVTSLRVVIKKN